MVDSRSLQEARQNLRPVHGDLIDRFTAIRRRAIRRGSADVEGTLPDADIAELMSFARQRESPLVNVAKAVSVSGWGGTRAELRFETTFRNGVAAGPPNRVIRFVRAAQVNRNFGSTKEEHTIPGYVCYRGGFEDRGPAAATEQYFRVALMRSFIRAKWSFDGPQEEFAGGRLLNVDTPGTLSSDLPYAITADFLIVLYDESAKKLLEVGHVGASLGVWARDGNAWRSTYVRSLRL